MPSFWSAVSNWERLTRDRNWGGNRSSGVTGKGVPCISRANSYELPTARPERNIKYNIAIHIKSYAEYVSGMIMRLLILQNKN